jgi:hypothetical protein
MPLNNAALWAKQNEGAPLIALFTNSGPLASVSDVPA